MRTLAVIKRLVQDVYSTHRLRMTVLEALWLCR